MQNWKKHKKERKTLFVNTTVLSALVKMSVFFCIFDFCCFSNFHVFQRCFLTGFQKSKNNKIWKQLKQKNNNQKTRCKAKINEMLWFKTTQDNKQNNKNKRTSWNKKSKHNKKKKQEPERENEKQEGRKKEKNKRETKKEKGKKGEKPQKG